MSEGKWKFIVAGVAALVGGAILFHLISNKEQGAAGEVFEEIDALGGVKKEPNGFLSFSYYKDIFGIIQKHSKSRFAKEKKVLLEQRRQLRKSGKETEYKELVKAMIQKEEASFGDLLQEAMDHLGLTEQEFMQMHQYYMSSPQHQQILMQVQMMPAGDGSVKITKEKTKSIFIKSEEKKMQSMKKMMMSQSRSQDPMEGMLDLMIEQAKLSDEMYEEDGVEEDEFNAAMVHYNLMNDPEVQRTIMQNMQSLGLGGGMGGGGGFGGY